MIVDIQRDLGRAEAGQARLLPVSRLLSDLATRLELGEGRARDGWREVAKSVDRRRRGDRLDPAVGTNLLEVRRPAGKVHRHVESCLRDSLLRCAQQEVTLLPLKLLNLLLEADLLQDTDE